MVQNFKFTLGVSRKLASSVSILLTHKWFSKIPFQQSVIDTSHLNMVDFVDLLQFSKLSAVSDTLSLTDLMKNSITLVFNVFKS